MQGRVVTISIADAHDLSNGIGRQHPRDAEPLGEADGSSRFPNARCSRNQQQSWWPADELFCSGL